MSYRICSCGTPLYGERCYECKGTPVVLTMDERKAAASAGTDGGGKGNNSADILAERTVDVNV